MKWTPPNVVSMSPRNSKGVGRGVPLRGVNSKDPKRIEFPELDDEGADDDFGDADPKEAGEIGAADEVPCTDRFPTDGAN